MLFKKKCLIKLFHAFLFLSLISCSHLNNQNVSLRSDQYWSDLVSQASTQKVSIVSLLEKRNPGLYNQILKDSEDKNLLNFWGQSFNFDSGAKKKILPDELIADLQAQFGIRNDNMIVHAGITHTYGYLFSVLQTPYGFKRKRWTEPTLNYAFGLTGNSLSPETIEGGLLSNITFFSGMLAFKNKSDQGALLKLQNVAKEILNFDYSKLSVETLEEIISDGEKTSITLRTTLVRLPFKKVDEENDFLLIYSIFNSQTKKELLVTAFPIKKDAHDKIITKELLGANQLISIRYNAYIEGKMDQKLIGIRKLSKERLRY